LILDAIEVNGIITNIYKWSLQVTCQNSGEQISSVTEIIMFVKQNMTLTVDWSLEPTSHVNNIYY
jgi:hypothetical protein